MESPRVFISYSHDSPGHKARVLKLATALRRDGVYAELDQFHDGKIMDWPRWCSERISREHSDFVVCVCTEGYQLRVENKVDPDLGKGVYSEGRALEQEIYDDKGNSRILPLLLDDEPVKRIPRFLRGSTYCRVREFALSDDGYDHLFSILTRNEKIKEVQVGPFRFLGSPRMPGSSDAYSDVGVRGVVGSVIVLALAVAGLFYVRELYPAVMGAALVMVALCLANCLWQAVLFFRRRRHDIAVREWAIRSLPTFVDDYFRVGPYGNTPADQSNFSRVDQADIKTLAWVRAARDPVLYLSGLSGAGKSSLINASLVPALDAPPVDKDSEMPADAWRVISISEHDKGIFQLRQALLKPGVIWGSPPERLPDEPVTDLLRDACAYLYLRQRRLLLLCDQFEVVMIRHQNKNEDALAFAQLLRLIAQDGNRDFPSLTVLLSYRSDYDDLLQTFDLPRWVDGKNGRRVAPFSRFAARDFLSDPRSGIDIAAGRLNQVLDEAEAVTSTPGLIRPIVLNMLGKLLLRLAGRDPVRVSRGALLSHDIRRTVEADEIRSYARPILRTLLNEGLRVRRTVAETAKATGLAPDLVMGCYKKLVEWPLVRCVTESRDPAISLWEIAHDFVARLLSPILEAPRRKTGERVRVFATPVLLLGIVAMTTDLWLGKENAITAKLSNPNGIHVVIEPERIMATAVVFEDVDSEKVPVIADLLRRYDRPVSLHLNHCVRLTNVDGLKILTTLEHLELGYCIELTSVKGLKGLPLLDSINLNECPIPTVDDLLDIPALRELRLDSCDVIKNVNGLARLDKLEFLRFRDNENLVDISGLEGLKSLKKLQLVGCKQVTDFSVLRGLHSLESLDLMATCIKDIGFLKDLKMLTALDVGLCEELTDGSVLREMKGLTEVWLQGSMIRNEEVLRELLSREGLIVHLDGAQQELMKKWGFSFPTPRN